MALPSQPRVGYLGPEGTFSEQALLASARPDSVRPVPRESIYDVVTALREGEVEFALVPIENSLEGSISVTLDLLAEDASGVEIVAEALLRVSHCLIAHEQALLQEIDTVLSHPQVPAEIGEEHVAAEALAARSGLDLREVDVALGEHAQAANEPAGAVGARTPEDERGLEAGLLAA